MPLLRMRRMFSDRFSGDSLSNNLDSEFGKGDAAETLREIRHGAERKKTLRPYPFGA